jgi:hypothetical protein
MEALDDVVRAGEAGYIRDRNMLTTRPAEV